MKRVLTAAVLIPIVIVALFRAPLWLFTLLVLGVALLAAREYMGIAKEQGFTPFRKISYIALVLCVSMCYVVAHLVAELASIAPAEGVATGVDVAAFGMASLVTTALTVLLLAPFVFLIAALRRDPLSKALPDAAISYLMLPYVAVTLGLLPILRSARNGALFVLYVMLLVWCGDITAYYVGRAIGRHKLAPRVSPGKTWEGTIASVVGAAIVGALLFHYINPIANAFRSTHLLMPMPYRPGPQVSHGFSLPIAPVWFVTLFAVCVNVVAQIGDLVESVLKRGAGMKDSGALLPGHGGVLDRIDALLFALPVGLLFYVLGMSRYFEPGMTR